MTGSRRNSKNRNKVHEYLKVRIMEMIERELSEA